MIPLRQLIFVSPKYKGIKFCDNCNWIICKLDLTPWPLSEGEGNLTLLMPESYFLAVNIL